MTDTGQIESGQKLCRKLLLPFPRYFCPGGHLLLACYVAEVKMIILEEALLLALKFL